MAGICTSDHMEYTKGLTVKCGGERDYQGEVGKWDVYDNIYANRLNCEGDLAISPISLRFVCG